MIALTNVVRGWYAAPFVALLMSWAAFVGLWVLLHFAYPVHIPLIPWPRAGSLSLNAAAFLFFAPPVVAATGAIVMKGDAQATRVSRAIAGCLAVSVLLATAFIALNLAG